MKKLLSILLTTAILFANEGSNYFVDNFLKYSTFYAAVNGGTSLSDAETPEQRVQHILGRHIPKHRVHRMARLTKRLAEHPFADGLRYTWGVSGVEGLYSAFLANGDDRTLRMDPRLPLLPQYTREAHDAGMPRGLICLGKLPNHYFGVPPSGAYAHLFPTDDAEERQLPLEQWLDEQIAISIEQLRDVETDEKGRVFQSISEDDLAAFSPGVDLAADGARKVTHPKFGDGEVLREFEAGTKMEIRFADGQVRTLLSRFVQDAGA